MRPLSHLRGSRACSGGCLYPAALVQNFGPGAHADHLASIAPSFCTGALGTMADPQESAEQLFCTALDLPPEARDAYLDRVCKDAPNLRRLVDDLLRENDRAGSFLAQPLLHGLPPPAAEGTETSAPSTLPALATRPPRFQPTQVIANRFVVVRFIARGGMGEVYEVQDNLLHGAPVALKLIRPEIAADAASSHRFEQEVLLARKVVHPNLCPIYEIFRTGEDPPFLFLTMKLLEGETLDACLCRSKCLERADIEQVAGQLIDGIAAIHAAGVIHRDLKPHNVMLARSAGRVTVSIMDFGLARLYDSDATLLGPGLVAGTPGYLAPELFLGKPPTQATDLFALGVMLHQVLTGERPQQLRDSTSVRARPSLDRADVSPTLITAVKDLLSDTPKQRCLAFDHLARLARRDVSPTALRIPAPRPLLTRRTFAFSSGAFALALAGGAVWKRDQIDDLVHPLPRKRFVALLPWPPPADNRVRPMLMGLIDAIANDLSRLEAFDHNFFVTSEKTVTDMKTPAQLNEVRESLGANLVLAATGRTEGNKVHVALHVMDPASNQTLRSREFRARLDELLSLPQRAVRAAAELLDVAHFQQEQHPNNIGTDNPQALAAFQQAELLRKQENDTGLNPAIEKYKEALEVDPKYAQAQARLGWAYIRSYYLRRETAALVLARANCEAAEKLDPESVDAHLGLAWLLHTNGDHIRAEHELTTALSLDPSNVHVLNYQAEFYADDGEYTKAEEAYRRATNLRPNFWLTHNALGYLLDNLGRYREALAEFQAASLAAPKNALALSNIGVVYLQLGVLDEAVQNANKSLAMAPTEIACAVLAEVYRIRNKPYEAIGFAKRGLTTNPASSALWIEFGDCNLAQGKIGAAMESYRNALTAEQEELRNEPKSGAGWMLLAFCKAKIGDRSGAIEAMNRASQHHGDDITSLLLKVRTLEILGQRDTALALAAFCVRLGATRFQLDTMPDLQALRMDPRYLGTLSGTGISGGAT